MANIKFLFSFCFIIINYFSNVEKMLKNPNWIYKKTLEESRPSTFLEFVLNLIWTFYKLFFNIYKELMMKQKKAAIKITWPSTFVSFS